MIVFGFNISRTRSIDLDEDKTMLKELEATVDSFKRCIICGNCTATCTAGRFTDFNIRKIHSSFRRGLYNNLSQELKNCMLCGKCTLVCPRGVNLRSLIINLRKISQKNSL